MALGVTLIGMAEDGTTVWRWMAHLWKGSAVLDLVHPPLTDHYQWQGPITREQIDALRAKAGGREAELKFRPSDVSLDDLLATPVHEIIVHVEEWGY